MSISKNCLVQLDYRLNDSDGNQLNPENELIYLQGGYGMVFAKVEEALEGKNVGDSVKVELTAAEAFGEFDENLVDEVSLSDLPDDIEEGMEMDGAFDDSPDDVVIYTVAEIRADTAVLDANHPLAGMPLVFEGTVTEIQELDDAAVKEILEHQHDHHHH
jgi:FKBP-type peptidyl-prolyl cis-trans isomerase SlyD